MDNAPKLNEFSVLVKRSSPRQIISIQPNWVCAAYTLIHTVWKEERTGYAQRSNPVIASLDGYVETVQCNCVCLITLLGYRSRTLRNEQTDIPMFCGAHSTVNPYSLLPSDG